MHCAAKSSLQTGTLVLMILCPQIQLQRSQFVDLELNITTLNFIKETSKIIVLLQIVYVVAL
jgi:hypothetical protein